MNDGSDLLYSAVQNFDIAEGERVEQNSPQREGVGSHRLWRTRERKVQILWDL